MTPEGLKFLGEHVWGPQGGLLSLAECKLLSQLIEQEGRCNTNPTAELFILEVGHFWGLSTAVISHAWPFSSLHIHTVDSHEADNMVPASDEAIFRENMRVFASQWPSLKIEIARSQDAFPDADAIAAGTPDIIFYDGDHREEQERFTRLVIEAKETHGWPSLFIFDDRDFEVPARCCELLREAGWSDESPPWRRLSGDKRNAETMTLGVFRK